MFRSILIVVAIGTVVISACSAVAPVVRAEERDDGSTTPELAAEKVATDDEGDASFESDVAGFVTWADDRLPEQFRDPSYERYVDLRLVRVAFETGDASKLADVALQLAEAERILGRKHRSGITADKLMSKAASLAREIQDEATLARLIKAAEAAGRTEVLAGLQATRKLAHATRTVDPALSVSLETTDVETLVDIKIWLHLIRDAGLRNDREELQALQAEIGTQEQLPPPQREALLRRVAQTLEDTGEIDEQDALLLKLVGSSRNICSKCSGVGRYLRGWQGFVRCDRCNGTGRVSGSQGSLGGYSTNKFDLMRGVESGGWIVAWSDDISETDALRGVVATGVSIYSANPVAFNAWLDQLITRTINSLMRSGSQRFPNAIRNQVRNLASDVIGAAVRGQGARQVLRQYDTVDFKAGAIRYSGRNWVRLPGGSQQTISTTWGMKPYVAFRWRGSR